MIVSKLMLMAYYLMLSFDSSFIMYVSVSIYRRTPMNKNPSYTTARCCPSAILQKSIGSGLLVTFLSALKIFGKIRAGLAKLIGH